LEKVLSGILPWVSFILGIAVTVNQIYINGRLEKLKSEIREEIKEELKDFKKELASQEQLNFMKDKTELLLQNIIFRIDHIAETQKRNNL
jgi:hypothetical protein